MKKVILLMWVVSMVLISCNKQSARTNQQQPKTTAKTILLTKSEFLSKVVNYEVNPTEWKYLGDKPAVIDFYADWCGPCKMIAPALEELAAEYGNDIYIYKIDTDKEQELAAAFGIRSIPLLLFVPMEGEPQTIQGAVPKSSIKAKIDTFLLNR